MWTVLGALLFAVLVVGWFAWSVNEPVSAFIFLIFVLAYAGAEQEEAKKKLAESPPPAVVEKDLQLELAKQFAQLESGRESLSDTEWAEKVAELRKKLCEADVTDSTPSERGSREEVLEDVRTKVNTILIQ